MGPATARVVSIGGGVHGPAHSIGGDSTTGAFHDCTIELYEELEQITGQGISPELRIGCHCARIAAPGPIATVEEHALQHGRHRLHRGRTIRCGDHGGTNCVGV